jgi:invasion protein IalB
LPPNGRLVSAAVARITLATSAAQLSDTVPSAPAFDTAAASRGTAAGPTGAWTMGCSIPSSSHTGVRTKAA